MLSAAGLSADRSHCQEINKLENSFIKIIIIVSILNTLHCSRSSDPNVCTDEFVEIRLTVIDNEGFPTDSVNITVYNKQNNKTYDLSEVNYPNSPISRYGIYTIYHDGFSNAWKGLIERIVIEGQKGNLSFNTECEVSSNACHVFKVSGPDTVILR